MVCFLLLPQGPLQLIPHKLGQGAESYPHSGMQRSRKGAFVYNASPSSEEGVDGKAHQDLGKKILEASFLKEEAALPLSSHGSSTLHRLDS